MDFFKILASKPRKHDLRDMVDLLTPWGEGIDEQNVLSEMHPHPQFARESWESLNGWWEYRFEENDEASEAWQSAPVPQSFEGRILVPFSPEARLSGVDRQLQPQELLWYRRTFASPVLAEGQRCLLHFEAVDYACRCELNGTPVGTHEGGYLPFSFDITDALAEGQNELVLCVHDPSDRGEQPRGKQCLENSNIWYKAQSGIWQPVWLEVVPEKHLQSMLLQPDLDTGVLYVAAQVSQPGETLSVEVFDAEGMALATAREQALDTAPLVFVGLGDPHPWSPDDPYLYSIVVRYGSDEVRSYCAFRTTTVEPDEKGIMRFCLNHEPLFLKGVLDQGYWPDGLMTAPSVDALEHDVVMAKELGFNMVRKHIKIESDLWYWLCDKHGMLVWQDMVSGGDSPYNLWQATGKPAFFRWTWDSFRDDIQSHRVSLSAGSERFRRAWTSTCRDTVLYLRNHPCIVSWVLFNEGWGQFDATDAMHMVRKLDPTRPIDAASGWYDQMCGDYQSIHNYFRTLEVYPDKAKNPRAFVISEFGGFSLHVPEHSLFDKSYGYAQFPDLESFQAAVRGQLECADALEERGLAGYVYTQLSDVEEETNGLITYDRRLNKFHAES